MKVIKPDYSKIPLLKKVLHRLCRIRTCHNYPVAAITINYSLKRILKSLVGQSLLPWKTDCCRLRNEMWKTDSCILKTETWEAIIVD